MTTAREQNSNFKAVLRRFVGRPGAGKDWTVKSLAETTGIHERTMASYYGGDTEPCWAKMLVIADALGPQFMNALLAPVGMGGVHIVDEADSHVPMQIAAMARNLSALSDAWEDEHIDHAEAARLAPEIEAHGVECIQFAAGLRNSRVVKIGKARAG